MTGKNGKAVYKTRLLSEDGTTITERHDQISMALETYSRYAEKVRDGHQCYDSTSPIAGAQLLKHGKPIRSIG